ncbi:MAG TPA: DUF4912 domain-containing protein [Treponema sp.]|nr:DUF4912 domain-containing protein [Treponema sp.]
MDEEKLTKTHLESLSTHDLLEIADDYGVDIPAGLNRRFIIGELLEMAEDNARYAVKTAALADSAMPIPEESLPESYNETRITVLLRDPGWIYIYWDFHTSKFNTLFDNPNFDSFFLRVNTFSREDSSQLLDFFDVEVGATDRKWYVRLSDKKNYYRVDLFCRIKQEKDRILAASSVHGVRLENTLGTPENTRKRKSPILELSGISELRKTHLRNHRQSFG